MISITICVLSAVVLVAVGGFLLAQTHHFELSKRALWGWAAVAGACWSVTRPLNDVEPWQAIVAALLALLALLLLVWGHSPGAPPCVRQVTGWGDIDPHFPNHTNTP